MTENPFRMSTSPSVAQGSGAARFTHADFVQYLQSIDDMASPPGSESESLPSSSPVSPPRGQNSSYTPSSSNSKGSPTKQGGAVQRTLKSRISELERDNKALTEDLRRTTRELDRKGGGAGEGVLWFSATTMKSKLKQVETQWNSDLKRQLEKAQYENEAMLQARLSEQASTLHLEAAHALDQALARQEQSLTDKFEREGAQAKQEYERRFAAVLRDVEEHKHQVTAAEASWEADHARIVQELQAKIADLDQELRASREVEEMGRVADAEASSARHARELERVEAELRADAARQVADATAATAAAAEEGAQARLKQCEAKWSAHCAATVEKLEEAHARQLARQGEAAAEAGAAQVGAVQEKLREAEAELEDVRKELAREKQANQENLSKLLALKSSAAEAQLRKAADRASKDTHAAVLAERAAADARLAAERAVWEAKVGEAVEQARREHEGAAAAARERAQAELFAAVEKAKEDAKAAQSVYGFELRGAHAATLRERDKREAELEARLEDAAKAHKALQRDTVQEVEVMRETLRAEKDAAVEAGVKAAVDAAVAEALASAKGSNGSGVDSASESPPPRAAGDAAAAASSSSAVVVGDAPATKGARSAVPVHVWLGSSAVFGAAVALVLLLIASRWLRMEPFVASPVF